MSAVRDVELRSKTYSTGFLRSLVCYVNPIGEGKSFVTTFPDPEFWKVFGPDYNNVSREEGLREFASAVCSPTHTEDFIREQQILVEVAKNSAKFLGKKVKLDADYDPVDAFYLTQNTGDKWQCSNPLFLVNKCLALGVQDFSAIYHARHMIYRASKAFDSLLIPEGDYPSTLCWSALLPSKSVDEFLSKYPKDSVIFSETFVSAVRDMKSLTSSVTAAFDLFPDLDRKDNTVVVFEMLNVEGPFNKGKPRIFDLSKLNPIARGGELLLNPGFYARIVSVEDGSLFSENDSIHVMLAFEGDVNFFQYIPNASGERSLSKSIRNDAPQEEAKVALEEDEKQKDEDDKQKDENGNVPCAVAAAAEVAAETVTKEETAAPEEKRKKKSRTPSPTHKTHRHKKTKTCVDGVDGEKKSDGEKRKTKKKKKEEKGSEEDTPSASSQH